jgi:hypothetical protein
VVDDTTGHGIAALCTKCVSRTAEEPASSLKSDGAAEASTAAGGRQQLPARLPDETLRETGPDEPHVKAGSESSQRQEEQGHAAQHRDSVVEDLGNSSELDREM